MPGFRPGKAPRRLLEAQFGSAVGREEALREAMPEYYAQAVIEHDADVVAPPEIEITGGQEDGLCSRRCRRNPALRQRCRLRRFQVEIPNLVAVPKRSTSRSTTWSQLRRAVRRRAGCR